MLIKCQSHWICSNLCKVNGGFPGGAMIKNPPANTGVTEVAGSIPEVGKSPGVRNGNPL